MTPHPWSLYLLVFAASCGVTLALVPLCRALAWRLDVVDRPSEARKVHRRVVPYLGGLAFYIAFLAAVFAVELFAPQHSQPLYYAMALVGTLIVLMGIYDDICDMSSLKKLVVEIALVSALMAWGFRTTEVASPFGGAVNLGVLALVLTPLWIAGVINAVNFSDGLDGLAAGLVCICAAAIFAIGFKNGQVASCILMAFLMGCTLAFLVYNFNPASIFMGDAGALFLGFILGAATLVENQKGVATIALAVPVVVMAIPILDTFLSFERRLRRARQGKFFTPDRDHLHHRLLDLGLTQRQVVLALYFLSAWMGVLAFILSVVPPSYGFLILILAGMTVAGGVAVLRFIESFAERE